jgi:heme exporter protein CcmD
MAPFLTFLKMGGYAAYVWPAYGLVFGVLVLQWFGPWKRWQKIKNKKDE